MAARRFAAEHAAAAAEIAAREEVKRTFARLRDRSDENDPATRAWRAAIARGHAAFAQVYPPTFLAALDDLKQVPVRDATTGAVRWTLAKRESIEIAIHFLEADVICFRSGYMKERLIRRLVRQPLGESDTARLKAVVLDVLDRRRGRDFRAYCRLAVRVADPQMSSAVEARLKADDETLRMRAGWVRDAIQAYVGGRQHKTTNRNGVPTVRQPRLLRIARGIKDLKPS